MRDATPQYLEALLEATGMAEAELMALVFRTGLRQLWREYVLSRYLRGEIGRDDAIDGAGLAWVELVERQREAALADLEWALAS